MSGDPTLTADQALRNAWGAAVEEDINMVKPWLDIAEALGDHGPVEGDEMTRLERNELERIRTRLSEFIDITNDGGPPGLVEWAGRIEQIVWPDGRPT